MTLARAAARLFYLAFMEAWEHFPDFGAVALRSLDMTAELLLPWQADHMARLGSPRAPLEAYIGPRMSEASTSWIFSLYDGRVYAALLVGAAVTDRWPPGNQTQ
jgi:dipeptide/tripeptide permease